jgi:hypothetical protein
MKCIRGEEPCESYVIIQLGRPNGSCGLGAIWELYWKRAFWELRKCSPMRAQVE